jgi:hypothetical protein
LSVILEKTSPRSSPGAARSSLRRKAISLTEVLIAMGILTLGLLGVAAIFPVGGYYMQKATIADNGSAIAQAVMNDIVSRGFLNPRTWRVMTPFPDNRSASGILFPSDTGEAGKFTRPLGPTLTESLFQQASMSDRTRIVQQFGSAFVLDPIGVAVMAFPGTSISQWNSVASAFPATAHDQAWTFQQYGQAWGAWGTVWPVRRVTFQQPNGRYQMDESAANHYFRGSDDLTTDLPDRDDRPASQNWETIDTDKNGVPDSPLARQWTGDYSWMVTVVPTSNAALEGIGRNPTGFAYDVSVVVFHKRALPADALTTGNLIASGPNPADQFKAFRDTMGDQERAVRAEIISTGLNGGELKLTDLGDNITGNTPFEGLKVGQWIMLCGPHPNSNVTVSGNARVGEPRFVMHWYQVLSIDTEAAGLQNFNPQINRVVAVRGPQWPWQPDGSNTSKNLCAAICRGAVAVHTKTLRLESPTGGSPWAVSSPTSLEPPGNPAF